MIPYKNQKKKPITTTQNDTIYLVGHKSLLSPETFCPLLVFVVHRDVFHLAAFCPLVFLPTFQPASRPLTVAGTLCLLPLCPCPPSLVLVLVHLLWYSSLSTFSGTPPCPPSLVLLLIHLLWYFSLSTFSGTRPCPPSLVLLLVHLLWYFSLSTFSGTRPCPPSLVLLLVHLFWYSPLHEDRVGIVNASVNCHLKYISSLPLPLRLALTCPRCLSQNAVHSFTHWSFAFCFVGFSVGFECNNFLPL